MPLVDQMCRECGTLEGVSYVTKICDKCKEGTETQITKEMLGEALEYFKPKNNLADVMPDENSKHSQVLYEAARAYAELPEKLRAMKCEYLADHNGDCLCGACMKVFRKNRVINDILKDIEG